MDLSQKEAVTEEMKEEGIKCCADCKITKTPLWRGGPSGPKSLCNACGIRHRKKRSTMVGLIKGKDNRREKTSAAAAAASSITTSGGDSSGSSSGKNTSSNGKSDKNGKLSEDLRVRLMALGKEVVVLQRRQRSPMKRQRSNKKLGEVEQAAVLLMALSRGSVFA